jgi:hypothetical protein
MPERECAQMALADFAAQAMRPEAAYVLTASVGIAGQAMQREAAGARTVLEGFVVPGITPEKIVDQMGSAELGVINSFAGRLVNTRQTPF